MSVELAEIRDFLAAHAPFDGLPDDVLDRLPASLSVRYLRRGTPVPPPDADRAYLYIVRQGAVETRDRRGELVDKQGEGGLYAAPCTANGPEAALASLTAEDTLLYLLPCERLEALRREHTCCRRARPAAPACSP
jgi:CBS domain-containing protein